MVIGAGRRVEGRGRGGGRDCLREMGGSGARGERRKSEGRAKEGRMDAEVLRMVWGWKWGRNVVEWKKMCIFAK